MWISKLFFLVVGFECALNKLKVPENEDVIDGQYIVVLKPGRGLLRHLDLIDGVLGRTRILRVLNSIGLGYVAKLNKKDLVRVSNLDEVQFIEPDTRVRLTAIETAAPWGLSRMSTRNPPTARRSPVFRFNPDGGQDVNVYVVDSGIDITHPDFEGRARWGVTILSNGLREDDNGHGTHVAGTIASKTYGIAKSANLVAVKVFGKNGVAANSDIIAGINWAVGDGSRGVINMSFGSNFSPALNRATEAAVGRGFVVSVAAGNQAQDACKQSPASAKGAITVAATDRTDTRAKYSNYGLCVTVFAPGDRIMSTWPNGITRTLSGTSMAAPHVSGLAAILLSRGRLAPAQISQYIVSTATKDIIHNPGFGSPDLLAYYDGQ